MQKAHAYHGEAPYCTRCYYRHFKSVACSGCGCSTRTLYGEEPGMCRTCRVKDRVCMRCDKPVLRSHFRAADGHVACKICRPTVMAPTTCIYCGKSALRVSRDFKAGFPEPACEQCRRAHFKTCTYCRKYREVASFDEQNRAVCIACVAEPIFKCPKCDQLGIRFSKFQCRRCYETQYARKLFSSELQQMTVPYVQKIYAEFFEHQLETEDRPIKFRRSIKGYTSFFQRIEKIAPTPMRLTPQALWLEFGRGGLRKNECAYNFLVSIEYVSLLPVEESDDIDERLKRHRLIEKVTVPWHRRTLLNFEAVLLARRETYRKKGWHGEHERFQARTISHNVRAAKRFLESLPVEVGALESISMANLDSFLLENSGHRKVLHSFVQYLNTGKKLFTNLSLVTVPRASPPMQSVMAATQSSALLKKWLHPTERNRKRSLIFIFMLLYGQTVTRATRLEWSQFVRGPDGQWQSKFAVSWVPLDYRVGKILDQYAEQFRPNTDDIDNRTKYLFPGRMPGTSLSPATVTNYLHEEGISAAQLFSSCIINAYRNGTKHPRTLVDLLGISMKTAVDYFNQIDSTAAKAFARKNGRE